MKKYTSEQLALFGKNRYHDWVVFFFTAVMLTVLSIIYGTFLYFGTQATFSDSSDVVVIPSRYGIFTDNVEFLSSYIEGKENTREINIPRDPFVR